MPWAPTLWLLRAPPPFPRTQSCGNHWQSWHPPQSCDTRPLGSVTEKARKGKNTLGDLRLGLDFLYLSLHLQNDKSQTDFRIFHALMFCEIILAKCFENWRMLLFRPPDFEVTVTVSGRVGVCDSLSPNSHPPLFLLLSQYRLSLWRDRLALAQCYYSEKKNKKRIYP